VLRRVDSSLLDGLSVRDLRGVRKARGQVVGAVQRAAAGGRRVVAGRIYSYRYREIEGDHAVAVAQLCAECRHAVTDTWKILRRLGPAPTCDRCGCGE
jgi:hypothetical protein